MKTIQGQLWWKAPSAFCTPLWELLTLNHVNMFLKLNSKSPTLKYFFNNNPEWEVTLDRLLKSASAGLTSAAMGIVSVWWWRTLLVDDLAVNHTLFIFPFQMALFCVLYCLYMYRRYKLFYVSVKKAWTCWHTQLPVFINVTCKSHSKGGFFCSLGSTNQFLLIMQLIDTV